MFCVNNAVYSNDSSRKNILLMDQLCVVTTDKALFFYEFSGTSSFKFEEVAGQSEKGIAIGGGMLPE